MDQQHSANEVAEIDKAMATLGKSPVDFVITPQMQAWIDYNAINGTITDNMNEGGLSYRKMTISEFATAIDVHRDTLRNWRTYIPNFWDRVNERRKEIAPKSQLQLMHNTWYLKALSMKNWPLTEAWLRNFDPGYKESKQKVEHTVKHSWAALMEDMLDDDVIEGEVLDEPAPNQS